MMKSFQKNIRLFFGDEEVVPDQKIIYNAINYEDIECESLIVEIIDEQDERTL